MSAQEGKTGPQLRVVGRNALSGGQDSATSFNLNSWVNEGIDLGGKEGALVSESEKKGYALLNPAQSRKYEGLPKLTERRRKFQGRSVRFSVSDRGKALSRGSMGTGQ